jgi:hypothetical protein
MNRDCTVSQIEILELKSTITEVKNSPTEDFKSRIKKAEKDHKHELCH